MTSFNTIQGKGFSSERSHAFWMRLDNAAKIYPAVQNEELTSVFRISCVLKERVRAVPLLKAVREMEDRFPYYKVKLRKGFFWYYLEYYEEPLPLKPDLGSVCRSFGRNDLIFRILAKGRQLSVEFSHILTDGGGGLEFLKTLLLAYFEACSFPKVKGVASLNPRDIPTADEFEDAFSKYVQLKVPHPGKKSKAFHLATKLSDPPRFRALVAKLSLGQLTALSGKAQVSVTEYLVSVYLHSLQDIYDRMSSFAKRRNRTIFRIQVPINLRKIYGSRTMRNFSLFVTPEIDVSLGRYSFEEILSTVHHTMRLETDKKLISKIIARNVGAERNMLLRSTPLFIKSLILYFTYSIAGPSRYSGVITNLGKISLGEADEWIDHFVFIPPPPNKALKVNCGLVGFNDSIVMSFGNITDSHVLERGFISFLVKQGIRVTLMKY